ncbi:protein kinase C-like [Venturia canescens]|uniref:protein kinase C-like n=1 Tax=Venturia canescens TaxID=32260 RepID=UPI001C9CA583|nr:protein kinase C-like [Venturia canescens]XP_043286128.1 protein kinase C-like [Venturia canescens]XP_043288842.1 protein kinase C-like [Venturia canescens]
MALHDYNRDQRGPGDIIHNEAQIESDYPLPPGQRPPPSPQPDALENRRQLPPDQPPPNNQRQCEPMDQRGQNRRQRQPTGGQRPPVNRVGPRRGGRQQRWAYHERAHRNAMARLVDTLYQISNPYRGRRIGLSHYDHGPLTDNEKN